MKITFLGTGTSQGIPVIGCECRVCTSLNPRDKRLRTSAYIELGNGKNLVIDTGPDFRQQMLREHIQKVDGVLFTHEHKDHTAGLDDVRAFNFKYKMDMPIYARNSVLNQLKDEYAYIFSKSKYPGVPRVQTNEIINKPFDFFGQSICPIEVMHGKLAVFGFRINDFTYITDANYISTEAIEKVKETKVLVLNALRNKKHISHFTLEEALEMIKLINPEKAYLTHFSHYLGLHEEVSAKLPNNVEMAYDGLTITL